MTITTPYAAPAGLPDPALEAEFYDGVVVKRGIAWIIDVLLIGLLTAVAVPATAFTGLFYLPVLFAIVAFLYRWFALSRMSATPGMLLTGICLLRRDGERLDGTTAFLHVSGYSVSVMLFPLQLISVALMLGTERAQGLTDHVIGTAAVRRSAAI
jgi:uncharacterized RDD family membrane protein YckC